MKHLANFLLVVGATAPLAFAGNGGSSPVDRTQVHVFEGPGAQGAAEWWNSHDDCHNISEEVIRQGVSYITRAHHWYGVRVWSGFNCHGENQETWNGADRRWQWTLEGHSLNKRVRSVSTCTEAFRTGCIARVSCSFLGGPLGAILGGIDIYNGDCRFCIGTTPFPNLDTIDGPGGNARNRGRNVKRSLQIADGSEEMCANESSPEKRKEAKDGVTKLLSDMETNIKNHGDMSHDDLKIFYGAKLDLTMAGKDFLNEWASSTLKQLDVNGNSKVDLTDIQEAKTTILGNF